MGKEAEEINKRSRNKEGNKMYIFTLRSESNWKNDSGRKRIRAAEGKKAIRCTYFSCVLKAMRKEVEESKKNKRSRKKEDS